MSGKPRAIVIGGSVGGLFAASLLRQSGWDALVFERAGGDLSGRGAAIGCSNELFDVMRRLDLPTETISGVSVQSYLVLDRSGHVTHEAKRKSITAAWAYIYRPLRAAFPSDHYHPNMTLTRIEADAATVTAMFANGTQAQGDIVIGADGNHSAVRHQYEPTTQPRYAGYVAWRGVVEERYITPADRELFLNPLVLCIAPSAFRLPIRFC